MKNPKGDIDTSLSEGNKCEFCNKEYANKSYLTKHYIKCTKKKENDIRNEFEEKEINIKKDYEKQLRDYEETLKHYESMIVELKNELKTVCIALFENKKHYENEMSKVPEIIAKKDNVIGQLYLMLVKAGVVKDEECERQLREDSDNDSEKDEDNSVKEECK